MSVAIFSSLFPSLLFLKSTFSEITQLSDFLLNARNKEPITWFLNY